MKHLFAIGDIHGCFIILPSRWAEISFFSSNSIENGRQKDLGLLQVIQKAYIWVGLSKTGPCRLTPKTPPMPLCPKQLAPLSVSAAHTFNNKMLWS